MKERPIIFQPWGIRAILDGRKTQTRRPLNPQPVIAGTSNLDRFESHVRSKTNCDGVNLPGTEREYWVPTSKTGKVGIFEPAQYKCPYGQAGDLLWVRETFAICYNIKTESENPLFQRHVPEPIYRADNPICTESIKWKPSIYMPRVASRLTLKVLSVRVEKIQGISEEDAEAEGIRYWVDETERGSDEYFYWNSRSNIGVFKTIWDSIHGPGAWERNDWVWAIEFERM